MDNATASKLVLDQLVSVATSSSAALDLSKESTLTSVFAGLSVSASAISLIASANSVVGSTLQDLYDVQSIIQGAVLEVSGSNADTAFKALNNLVSMVNNPDPASRQQVLEVSLASNFDLGDNPNTHISFDATPIFRVNLLNLIAKKSVAAGDLVILNDSVDALSAQHTITADDLAKGYAEISLAQLPVKQGILISAQIFSQSTDKIYAKGFTSISMQTPSVVQDLGLNSAGQLSVTGKLASLAGSGGVDPALGNLGTLALSSDGSYTYSVDNNLAKTLNAGEVHIDTFTVKLGSGSSASRNSAAPAWCWIRKSSSQAIRERSWTCPPAAR
jgi:VCBS repeat-containing protein